MKIRCKAKIVDSVENILKKQAHMSYRIIKKNESRIFVNKEHKLRADVVNIQDNVEIELLEEIEESEKFINKYKCKDKNLNILYEDEYILVIDKEPGVPIHPSINNYEDTLSNYVASYLKQENIYGMHIITRLDKDTSGICIFAKHPYIQELFNTSKEKIKLKKEYVCVVDGMTDEHGIIEAPIGRKDNTIILREVRNDGKYAKTEYFLEKYIEEKDCSMLRVILHTGRTHQIRVHMAYIGHTLLGDDLYAKDNKKVHILKYIKRQALHCIRVSFIHPITQNKICVESGIPKDIYDIMN